MDIKDVVIVSYVWVQKFIQQPIEWPHPKEHRESNKLGGHVSSLDSMSMDYGFGTNHQIIVLHSQKCGKLDILCFRVSNIFVSISNEGKS